MLLIALEKPKEICVVQERNGVGISDYSYVQINVNYLGIDGFSLMNFRSHGFIKFLQRREIPSTQPVCFKILPTNNFNLCHSNGKSHKFLQIIIPFNLSYTKRKVQNDFHSFSEGKMLITFHEVEFFSCFKLVVRENRSFFLWNFYYHVTFFF